MRRLLSVFIIFIILASITVIGVNAEKTTAVPSGLDDSADYLLKVPQQDNYIYYSNWKAHGLSWTSFTNFCKSQFNKEEFAFNKNGGYIYSKTINGENFYEAEFNMKACTFDTLDGCNIIAIQPVQIQFDKNALESGENVPLGNYIDTSSYKYVATRIKVEGGRDYQRKIISVMLRAKGRDQYIDNMAGSYIINNKTRRISGPTPNMKYIEVENGFDGWIVMPVEDIAEGKALSELVTVSFFCHSTGMEKNKCSHGITDTAWDFSTLYIGDMMLVKDIDKFNSVRTSCEILGHELGEPIINPATTTKEGTSTVKCTACGFSQTTPISKLTSVIKGNKVEGLTSAIVEVVGDSNINSDVYFNAQNITTTIKAKEKNSVIRSVNSLSDKIKARKIASVLDLKLITKSKDNGGKTINNDFTLSGKIKITVPIDSKTISKYKDINLILVKSDESATVLNYSITGDKAIFETEALGYFVFVGREKTSSDNDMPQESIVDSESEISSSESSAPKGEISVNNEIKPNNDNDELPIVLIILAGVVALGLIIFAIILFVKK